VSYASRLGVPSRDAIQLTAQRAEDIPAEGI
jgi:hypothetical protein